MSDVGIENTHPPYRHCHYRWCATRIRAAPARPRACYGPLLLALRVAIWQPLCFSGAWPRSMYWLRSPDTIAPRSDRKPPGKAQHKTPRLALRTASLRLLVKKSGAGKSVRESKFVPGGTPPWQPPAIVVCPRLPPLWPLWQRCCPLLLYPHLFSLLMASYMKAYYT